MFSKDFKEFVQLLIQNKAEYLIVGGYAVGIHGHPRYTGDLDVWINPTEQNAEIILKCLRQFGFSSIQLSVADLVKPGAVVQLGYPPYRIDLLRDIDGVVFEYCFNNRKVVDIEGMPVNFIGLEELLVNKRHTGRLRDLDDIEHLR